MEQREGIVLAGGLGTRLRSVVSDLPKCMAPVAGRPFLYYLLKYMEVRRFTRVVLALGYMHESVQRWLAGEKWDFEIRCSLEETPLGTGGAVRQALSRTDGDEVYILNGDTFFDVDTDEMARVHRASGAAATIALKPMTDFSRYGVVETASQGRIVAFREKNTARADRSTAASTWSTKNRDCWTSRPNGSRSKRIFCSNGYGIVCSPDMRATVISSTSAFLKITKKPIRISKRCFRDDRANRFRHAVSG